MLFILGLLISTFVIANVLFGIFQLALSFLKSRETQNILSGFLTFLGGALLAYRYKNIGFEVDEQILSFGPILMYASYAVWATLLTYYSQRRTKS